MGGSPAFSPDGASIAFTALVDDFASTLAAPLVIEGDPSHKVDGVGWIGTARTQVFVVPLGGGTPVRMTIDGQCTSPSWSPNGAMLAFAQFTIGTEGTRFCRRVGLVDVTAPCDSVRFPFIAVGTSGPLTWAPDGESIVAIGQVEFQVGLNRLVRLYIADGDVEVLTSHVDRNVMGGGPGTPAVPPGLVQTGGSTSVCGTAARPSFSP